jgi:hypothetical protein
VTATPYRCSAASREIGEPCAGTASTVRRFLLVEQPGPWGVDAITDARLPDVVKQHLLRLRDVERIRPLLVRRCAGVTPGGGVQVLLADAATGRLAGTVLDAVEELVDLDLATLEPAEGPVFLACTHGRHDACCAERGRPLATALAAVDPVRTWEVSHIGGDRFAPNVLVLPHGLYYGRLVPDDAARFVARHLDGRLDVDHLRGRSTSSFPVQAAEVHLRGHLEEDRIGAVTVLRTGREGDDRVVDLGVDARRWRVRVRPVRQPAARLTCKSSTESAAVTYVPVGVERLPDESSPV